MLRTSPPGRAALLAILPALTALGGHAGAGTPPAAHPDAGAESDGLCAEERWAIETERAGRLRTRKRTFRMLAKQAVGEALAITEAYWKAERRAWTEAAERDAGEAVPEGIRPPEPLAEWAGLCRAVAKRSDEDCRRLEVKESAVICQLLATSSKAADTGVEACETLPRVPAALCIYGITGDEKACRAQGPEVRAACDRAIGILEAPAAECARLPDGLERVGACFLSVFARAFYRGTGACEEAVSGGDDHPEARRVIRGVCEAAVLGAPESCPAQPSVPAMELRSWADAAVFPTPDGNRLVLAAMASPPATCYAEMEVSQPGLPARRLPLALALSNRMLTYRELALPAEVDPLRARVSTRLRCIPGWW